MMIYNKIIDQEIDFILSNISEKFTCSFLHEQLTIKGVSISYESLYFYIVSNPLVQQVSEDTFIFRPSFCTNYRFGIKPGKNEILQGTFIVGHRCLPFVNPEMLPHELTFFVDGNRVISKQIAFNIAEVLKAYELYGEEYVAQYISLDPANEDTDFAKKEYELPQRTELVLPDLSFYYDKWNFKIGDRLLCKVIDWEQGFVEISYLENQKKNPFLVTEEDEKREKWFLSFENGISMVLEDKGPCSSIEEQLLYAFTYNKDSLDIDECGSVEEYMEQTKKICIQEYGVESRLWRIDEEIPIMGSWITKYVGEPEEESTILNELGIPGSDSIVDAFILDAFYEKSDDVKEIYTNIIPDNCVLDKWQSSLLLLHIHKRYAIIAKDYNWFADFEVGRIRHIALDLYKKLVSLIYEIDGCKIPLEMFPQQSLVVLSQLYGHTYHLIEALLYQINVKDKDISAADLSLDGMKMSFEDVHDDLYCVINKHRKDGFSILGGE
jgi:hypothetical protein